MERLLQEQFVDHMRETQKFYDEFLILEDQKFQALSQNALSAIDGLVKQEEVALLRSRGFERDRELLLEKLGCSGMVMSELIQRFDSPLREELLTLYETLSGTILDVKDMNTRCETLANLRLRRTEKLRSLIEQKPDAQRMYTDQAKRSGEKGSLMSKKV